MAKGMRYGNAGAARKGGSGGTGTPMGPKAGQDRRMADAPCGQKLTHPSQRTSAQQWHKNRAPSQDGGSN